MAYTSHNVPETSLSPETAWMNLESIILSGISQSEINKCYMASLYMESKEHIKGTNKTETDSST